MQIKNTLSLLWWSIVQSLKVSPFLFLLRNITTIILSVFFIVYSKLQGNLIDSFSRVHDGIWIVIIPAIALLSFTVIRDILDYLNWSLMGSVLRQKQERYYTRLFLHHYSKLDIGRIEQSEFQDLKNKVSDKALWTLRRLPEDISQLIGSFVALLLGAGIIFSIHPLAALSVILGTIPSFVVEIYYAKAQRKVWDGLTTERRASWSMRNSFESKRTIQELIISNRTKAFLDRIDNYLDKEYKLEFGVEKKFIIQNILVKIIETLSIGGALYFIILQGFQGILSIGEIVFSFGVLYSINSSLASVVRSISDISSNVPYLQNVKEYFDTKPLIKLSEKPIALPNSEKINITFENVSFKYLEKDEYVLKDVSFSLPHGEKFALVGLNGAGKTTLIKLILRMYDPTQGKILVNGVDLKKLDLVSWYDNLGVLLQDFSKYEFLSIKDSIKLFAKTQIVDDEIHNLLKKVRADSIIASSEAGLDLMQSSEYGGKELSGGQFQKIAIARTLSRNANFVILDEPTSAIDALSEEAIFETLNKLPVDSTLLFISHRFTTIRNANHIIVLNNGKIEEEGSHEKLIDHKGLYAQMYRSQVLGEK
jgi:ATP-binding cassette subfamily B protein